MKKSLYRNEKIYKMFIKNPQIKCTNCGYKGIAERHTQGTCCIELVLWFFFIIPGIIYSIWRVTSRKWRCPKCKWENPVIEG